jgi:aspartyl-tRNA(Asn)/glutamyl-tRNA(Gln) amidotransferase subunit A
LVTLKEALSLSEDQLISLTEEIKNKIEENKQLGAYVEQLTSTQ